MDVTNVRVDVSDDESIVPDGPSPSWERTLDMHMLAIYAGRERTRQQYAELLEATWLTLVRETDTASASLS